MKFVNFFGVSSGGTGDAATTARSLANAAQIATIATDQAAQDAAIAAKVTAAEATLIADNVAADAVKTLERLPDGGLKITKKDDSEVILAAAAPPSGAFVTAPDGSRTGAMAEIEVDAATGALFSKIGTDARRQS